MDLKNSLGLDISMNDIKANLCVINDLQEVRVICSGDFVNSKSGISSLISWFNKKRNTNLPHCVIMEPTGVYYESCAYEFHKAGLNVSVVVASMVKNYLLSLGQKSKNDMLDAKGIATMGAQRNFKKWTPMPENLMHLRTLTRHYQSLQEKQTVTKNQLHAEQISEIRSMLIINQLKASIAFDKNQLKAIMEEIKKIVKTDTELNRKFKIVLKIIGVGLITAVTVVVEYGGFDMFLNYKAVISFAGYDVVENQSGKHSGKTKISKRGNSRIRRILFLPAFTAITHKNEPLNSLFDRILLRNGQKLKMKAYVAVQKKLLIYIYYAWKKEIDYSKAKIQKEEQVTASPLDNIAAFEKNAIENIEIKAKKEKSSHISVAAQGSNPVSYHSITPHRYNKIT